MVSYSPSLYSTQAKIDTEEVVGVDAEEQSLAHCVELAGLGV